MVDRHEVKVIVSYNDFLEFILNGIHTYEDNGEWIILMTNLWLPEDGSGVCEEQSTNDSYGIVKVIVVKCSDLVTADDFSCLVDGGTSGENYNEYNDFDEASIESNTNGVRDEICKNAIGSSYLISLGCVLTDEECDYVNDYSRDLIELTYNPEQIDMGNFLCVIHGGAFSGALLGENRDVVLSACDAHGSNWLWWCPWDFITNYNWQYGCRCI